MIKMMATVCKRGTITREQRQPPTTAGTGTMLQLGGNGNGTANVLLAPPPAHGWPTSLGEEGFGS
jgi:hypothetical protein